MPVSHGDADDPVATLLRVGKKARAFVSMPVVEGITPRILVDPSRSERAKTTEGLERRHGVFRLDEIGLPLLDHDVLYGDACFEGILIRNKQIFLLREHLNRLWRSAHELGIAMPYEPVELAGHLLDAIRHVTFQAADNAYIRLVVSRGLGDLGINPKKCVGATLFALVSTIALYSTDSYEQGISLGIARSIRRPDASIVDPRIKSNNYLNNVLALREGSDGVGAPECIMLTKEGFVAEATVDNLFLVIKEQGWKSNPRRVKVLTPAPQYCLNGITREIILQLARELEYVVEESATILPLDLAGDDREVFMTGTGAFVMPITGVAGHRVGDGRPGEVTRILLGRITAAMTDPSRGLSLHADAGEVRRYLEG